MLTTLLLLLGGLVVGSVLVVVLALWWASSRLKRRNRVVPTETSPAPVTWLVLPNHPARLHRRLQVAVRVVRVHAGLPDRPGRKARQAATTSGAVRSDTVDALVAHLEADARLLDAELTRAARHPRSLRKAELAELDARVAHVEQVAGRIAQLAVDDARASLPPGDPRREGTDPLAEQLALLEAARAELARAERRGGLVDPNGDDLPQSTPAPSLPPSSPSTT